MLGCSSYLCFYSLEGWNIHEINIGDEHSWTYLLLALKGKRLHGSDSWVKIPKNKLLMSAKPRDRNRKLRHVSSVHLFLKESLFLRLLFSGELFIKKDGETREYSLSFYFLFLMKSHLQSYPCPLFLWDLLFLNKCSAMSYPKDVLLQFISNETEIIQLMFLDCSFSLSKRCW